LELAGAYCFQQYREETAQPRIEGGGGGGKRKKKISNQIQRKRNFGKRKRCNIG